MCKASQVGVILTNLDKFWNNEDINGGSIVNGNGLKKKKFGNPKSSVFWPKKNGSLLG